MSFSFLKTSAVVFAGCAVLAGGAAFGGLYWQGDLFDKHFPEGAQKAAEAAQAYGIDLRAEELGRSLHYRDIAVVVKVGGKSLRWTGRASFGFEPVLQLRKSRA